MFTSVAPPSTQHDVPRTVRLMVDGRLVEGVEGMRLAALLLTLDDRPFRAAPVSGAPRAPYCMMGVCFECLVEVDGMPGQQACLLPLREGMQVCRRMPNEAPEA
jgi:hypothetical protein